MISVPGIGQLTATALTAFAGNGEQFKSARHLASWLRVVCNNTLQITLGESAGAAKVPHRSRFDQLAVKRQLGIAISSWNGFMARMKALADCKVNDAAAETFLRRVLTYQASGSNGETATNERAIKAAHALYAGQGMGATLASASGRHGGS